MSAAPVTESVSLADYHEALDAASAYEQRALALEQALDTIRTQARARRHLASCEPGAVVPAARYQDHLASIERIALAALEAA